MATLRQIEVAEDYKAFEAVITADYDAQSAVERELVLRLASLLWRIRRATRMESGLFEIQATQLLEFRKRREAEPGSDEIIHRLFGPSDESDTRIDSDSAQMTSRTSAKTM